MCSFAIVTPGSGNGKLLASPQRLWQCQAVKAAVWGRGTAGTCHPPVTLWGVWISLGQYIRPLLSWAQSCTWFLHPPVPRAWAATPAWCPCAWEPGCEHSVPVGRKVFLPRKHCQAVTPSGAERCTLMESWEPVMLGVAKDRGCPTVTPTPSCLHTPRWSSPRATQRCPARLDLLYWQESVFPLCSLAKQLGGDQCRGTEANPAASRVSCQQTASNLYPRGALMLFSENGGAKWSWWSALFHHTPGITWVLTNSKNNMGSK